MGEEKHGEGRHGELFELATRQHGVVSTRQLAALGYSPSSASKAAKVGRLRRVHRGVYMVGHERLTWHGRCMAALLACRPSVASHQAAAWLWGLLRYQPEKIDLTAPTQRHPRRAFVAHWAVLRPADIAVVDKIPLTSLARTKLDLAAVLSEQRLGGLLERSEELGLLDLTALEEVCAHFSHHAGCSPLKRASAIYKPEPALTRSGLERRFLELVRKAGLPQPAMNYVVAGMELDAYWERERFVVELDVYETHGTRGAFERDRIRQDDLLALGIEMIRVTGPRLRREPDAIMRRLAAHLERRRGQ